jgi:hypothetical protein
MPAPSHQSPDIEIYIKQGNIDEIRQWLSHSFENITHRTPTNNAQKQYHYHATYHQQSIPILIVPQVIDHYTSVWINSPQTPWKNDIECARDAYQALQKEIRCTAGSWEQSEDPDLWWSITQKQETTVIWKTT